MSMIQSKNGTNILYNIYIYIDLSGTSPYILCNLSCIWAVEMQLVFAYILSVYIYICIECHTDARLYTYMYMYVYDINIHIYIYVNVYIQYVHLFSPPSICVFRDRLLSIPGGRKFTESPNLVWQGLAKVPI